MQFDFRNSYFYHITRETCTQFRKHFTISFCTDIHWAKNYKTKLYVCREKPIKTFLYEKAALKMLVKLTPGVNPTKLFFLRFFFFGIKLGHFSINIFFLCVTKMQAYQQKTEKFSVSEEKKFGRIDSCTCQRFTNFSFGHQSATFFPNWSFKVWKTISRRYFELGDGFNLIIFLWDENSSSLPNLFMSEWTRCLGKWIFCEIHVSSTEVAVIKYIIK